MDNEMMNELMDILKDCCPDIDFETEKALVDDQILDSLSVVMLSLIHISERIRNRILIQITLFSRRLPAILISAWKTASSHRIRRLRSMCR